MLIINNLADRLKRNWSLLFKWTGILFCFFVFPAFIVDASYQGLLEIRLKNRRIETWQNLAEKLELVRNYGDQKKYFHHVLSRIFAIAREQQHPISYIEAAINRLKENYPDQLEFIVWNSQGQLVEHLTDEKRYRYILRRLHQVLLQVSTEFAQNDFHSFTEAEIVVSSTNLIRQFLGRIFLNHNLALPYLDDENADLILVDYGEKRPYFWYHVDENLGILCFFSAQALEGHRGLEKLIEVLNGQSDTYKLGFASVADLTKTVTDHGALEQEIVLALHRFENGEEPQIETANAFISIQLLERRVRAFSYVVKDALEFDMAARKRLFMTRVSIVYLLGLFAIIAWIKFRLNFFSIRWKLVLLFVYANLAPLLILGFLSFDYLQNRRLDLINETRLQATRIVREFDESFLTFKHDQARGISKLIENFNVTYESSTLSASHTAYLADKLRSFSYSELYIMDTKSNVMLSVNADGEPLIARNAYMTNLADALLKYNNRIIVEYDNSDLLNKLKAPQESEFLRRSLVNSGEIWDLQVGDAFRAGCWNFIGQPEIYQNNYMVMMVWTREKLEDLFLRSHYQQLTTRHEENKFFALNRGLNSIFPQNLSQNSQILAFMKTAGGRDFHTSNELIFDNVEHLAVGIKCNHMHNVIMAAIFPVSLVEKEINRLRMLIMLGAILSLALAAILAMAISGQLLTPMHKLSQAVSEINRANFRHRVDIADHDEFGHLGQVINRVTEGLGELEIAKVVQESLFPQEKFSQSPFEIYGKSVATSTLGGDYLDYFAIDEERFGVLLGDVSGHGASAALIMAMAKSGVKTLDTEELLDPAKLLESIHPIIFSLKSKKMRRIMTMQYLVIEKNSGAVTMANAGHCFPLLLSPNAERTAYVKSVGHPLGIRKEAEYNNHSFKIEPGDSLVLYTDGIVEALDLDGTPVGFDNFAKMANESSHCDPQLFYENLSACHKRSVDSVDDDTTLIIINYRKDAND